MSREDLTPEERIDRYLLGQATTEDIEILNELLAKDEELRKLYRFRVALEGGYREAAIREENPEPSVSLAFDKMESDQGKLGSFPYRFAIAAASFAAVAIFALAQWNSNARTPSGGSTPPDDPVARLVASVDADWRDVELMSGALLEVGSFQLESGTAELEFNSGARVTLQGPSTFELKGTDSLHVSSGNLVAKIPEEAIGFTVTTDEAEVIDLGTEFGMRVGGGRPTEVHVIDGLVEVFEREGSSHRSQEGVRIEEGQAVRLKADAPDEFASESIPVRSSRGVLGASKLDDLGLSFLQGNIRLKEKVSRKDLKLKTTSWIEVIPEKSNVLLDQELPVTLVAPGNYRVFADSGQMLATGTKVDSFLIHFRSTQPEPIHAVIKFDRRIVGVVCEASQLRASDSILGREGVDYPAASNQFRGLDPHRPNGNPDMTRGGGWTPDAVTVSKDMRTLGLSVNVVPTGQNSRGVDQLRVLVESED